MAINLTDLQKGTVEAGGKLTNSLIYGLFVLFFPNRTQIHFFIITDYVDILRYAVFMLFFV